MSKIKLYDLIKQLLTDHPELRDSDKKLIWKVWEDLKLVDIYSLGAERPDNISYDDFMHAPSTESIRRCRQKIQETRPELRSSKKVQEAKKTKEASRGTWIYREPVQEVLV